MLADVTRDRKWRIYLLAAAVLVAFLLTLSVLLVLTGIIAEPETVIEDVVRMLFGG